MPRLKPYRKFLLLGCLLLPACTHTTPSGMNLSPVELVEETSIEQIAMQDVTSDKLKSIAHSHRKNGDGVLDVTVTFDPKSKEFTAMKAIHALSDIEKELRQQGIANLLTHTLPVEGGKPTLMVSYDMVRAQAPSSCDGMPGLNDYLTDRDLGKYRFGCGVESMFAKQVARPKDLKGNATLDGRSARRDSVVVDEYSAGVPREPLEEAESTTININSN